jgi:hypothetical protein
VRKNRFSPIPDIKEQPGCAEAMHFLGLAAMQRGKLDKALELVPAVDRDRADAGGLS